MLYRTARFVFLPSFNFRKAIYYYSLFALQINQLYRLMINVVPITLNEDDRMKGDFYDETALTTKN